jgi:hypothetical protein
MKDQHSETPSSANLDASPSSPSDHLDQAETPSRRELIERYGKYAIIAGPLLMFVSKAHAIHSKP